MNILELKVLQVEKYLNFTPTEEYLELEKKILGEGFSVISTTYYPHYIIPWQFAYLNRVGIPEMIKIGQYWTIYMGKTEIGRVLTIKDAIKIAKGE